MHVRDVSFVYMFASATIFSLIAFFIPKRMYVSEMYITVLFSEILQVFTDIIFSVKYDWYGYFYKGPDIFGLFVVIGIFPAITIIYLNFFPYGSRWSIKALYILVYSVFAVFYEWTSVLSGYFYYNGWKLWYSVPFYPFLYGLLAWHYYVVKKFTRKHYLSDTPN